MIEIFGTRAAATIVPIGGIMYKNKLYSISNPDEPEKYIYKQSEASPEMILDFLEDEQKRDEQRMESNKRSLSLLKITK